MTACLEEYGLLQQGGDYTERLANTVRDLLDNPGKAAATQVILQAYLSNIKRLVEAIVKEEGD